MQAFIGWFVVVTLGTAAVVASVELTQNHVRERMKTYRFGVLTILGSAIGLVVLAVVWKFRTIAHFDGAIIALLAVKRSHGVTEVMNIVTTIGDPIPSFTIAAVLAMVVYMRTNYRMLAVLLPLAVVLELVAQILITDAFHDITIAELHPGLPLGGAGTIPSGSVARLFSIFLIAAQLLGSRSTRSRALTTVGSALVIIQSITRLYLGRHLLADIVGGLLLGIILTDLACLVIRRVSHSAAHVIPADSAPRETAPRDATPVEARR